MSKVSQHKTWVEVNAAALRHNFCIIQKHVGKNVAVMAIVKSNAYGHGLLEVAHVLCGKISGSQTSKSPEVRLPEIWYGVDSIDEALLLKKSGIKNPTLILGYIPPARLTDVIQNGFRFALYDIGMLHASARIAKKLHRRALVHIKIETGTYRQGIALADLLEFIRLLKNYSTHAVVVAEGVYTHFADTENPTSHYYKEQLKEFEKALVMFQETDITPSYIHASASAGLILYPETHFNMVRLGISLYGMYPSEGVRNLTRDTLKLQPALTWKTRVAQIKTVLAGKTIGYDRAYEAKQNMKIAILPVGYWDGYDRRLSHRGTVIIGGKYASVVGNICMNMMMVDVTGRLRVKAGDEVTLLGKQGSAKIIPEELAEKVGTINYEIIARINPLIPRVLV